MDVFARQVTMRHALGQATKRALHEILNAITTDRHLLCLVVAGGKYNWRKHLYAALQGFSVNDDIADRLWARLEQCVILHAADPTLSAKETAFKELDAYVPPPTPPTEAEIDKAWVHEIASSEQAMRQMYEGSARVRKGTLH